MQITSQTYKDIIAGGDYWFEVVLGITDANGDNYQEFGMDKLFSLTTESKIFTERTTIGGVYSATCEFSLLDDGSTIPRMARVTPQYWVTDGVNDSEPILKGEFFIDTRSVSDNGNGVKVFNAFCYDRMSLANKPYTGSSLLWPAEDTDVLTEIAHAIGVVVDARTSSYITMGRTLGEPDGDATYRDYLSYIGVMYGGNWVISDDGLLLFIPVYALNHFSGREDTIYVDPSEVTTLDLPPGLPSFTGVKIETSEDSYVFSGTSEDRLLEAYCPFVTQTIADYIYLMAVNGRQPFTASGVWIDPSIELGDNFVFVLDKSDPSGTQQFVGRIDNRDISFGRGICMEVSSPNDSDIDHEFVYTDPTTDRTNAAISSLTTGLGNLSTRNLIINTKNPEASEQSEWPRLYEQADNTRTSDWAVTAATHGIRCTKGTSSQTNAAFVMGGTTPGSSTASMNGLEAGHKYTFAYDFNYKVLPSSTTPTYARWRLIYFKSNTAGATSYTSLLRKTEIVRNTATSDKVSFTFTVPEDAVVCSLYFNFCDNTDTNIPNSSFSSSDYYEFANMILVSGTVAPGWVPAPEDGASETAESVASNGTSKTFQIDTNGTYLLTVTRMNGTNSNYDGAWLVEINTNSHLLQLAKGSSAPTPTVSGNTLSLTTTVANQRITITRLS